MLASCSPTDTAGVWGGIPRGVSWCQRRVDPEAPVCLRVLGPCGSWPAENLVYLSGWAATARPFFVYCPNALITWGGASETLTQATKQLVKTLVELIDPICRAHGVDLVDVRYLPERGGAVIRVIIDRGLPGREDGSGVSLDDCTGVSRDVSTTLDLHEESLPSSGYRLEVSSPGLERPLVKLADFERFSGREIKLRTRTAIERQRRFRGRLLGVVDRSIELDQDGAVLVIPHEDIAQANLVYRSSKLGE